MRRDRPERQGVLVVDDEPQVALAIAELLEDRFRVVTETSPHAALEILKSDRNISVVLSDQRMPGMTGEELFARARSCSLAARVLITAYADIGAVIEAVNQGKIFGYVTKPWQPDDIILMVKRAADYCGLNKQIRHERALLRQLMESSVDAIYIKDRAHRYVKLNAQQARILGVDDAAKVEGRTSAGLLPPERARARHRDEVELFRSGKPIRDRRERVLTREGSERWYSSNMAPIRNVHGEMVGLVGITRDITETKKLDDLKDQFIATVRHELRTPLTAIRGALGLLRSGAAGALGEKAEQMIAIGCNNCDKLVSLINDLLDAEMFGKDDPKFDFATLDFPETVTAALEANKGLGRARDVTVRLEGDLPRVQIRADRARLLQVFSKLVSNAVEVAPPGSQVTVLARETTGDTVRVSVVDRGPGVPGDFHGEIFKKFSKADHSDTREKGGAGLGLYIAKSIIDAHGGRIGFESTDGKGSEFYFDLPISGRPRSPATRLAAR